MAGDFGSCGSQQVIYDAAAAEGVAGVYGFPNSASVSGFEKRLDWSMMDPLPMLIHPIGTRYARVRAGLRAPGMAGAHDGSTAPSVPDDVNDLFAAAAGDGFVAVQRDAEYLRWRFARPGRQGPPGGAPLRRTALRHLIDVCATVAPGTSATSIPTRSELA